MLARRRPAAVPALAGTAVLALAFALPFATIAFAGATPAEPAASGLQAPTADTATAATGEKPAPPPSAPAAAAKAPTPAPDLPVLHPEPIHLDVPDAGGSQFLGADARGRLVLLRGDRPQFYEIPAAGAPRPWGDPDSRRAALDAGLPGILDAARSPDGTWLLATPDRLLTVSPHEVEILHDPRWLPLAVAMPDRPVAAVLPVIRGRVKPPRFDPHAPPLLLEHTSSGWAPLLAEPFTQAERDAPQDEHSLRAFRALRLAPASAGGLWAAHRYLYRLRRVSAAGRELLDLTLVPAPTPEPRDDDAIAELRASLAAQAALLGDEDAVIRPFTARPVLHALAEGRDGKLYLYVAPGVAGPRPLLDRYDPVTHRLERAVLDLDPPGAVTLAAARDGLWIAAVRARHQLWRLPWPTLDALPWHPVPDLHLDGHPLPP